MTDKTPEPRNLFHPLTHSIFSADCPSWSGGRRRHLACWWEFIGRFRVRRFLACPSGVHYPMEVLQGPQVAPEPRRVRYCAACGRVLEVLPLLEDNPELLSAFEELDKERDKD